MANPGRNDAGTRFGRAVAARLGRPEMLAFIPAIVLSALWFGGDGAAWAAVLALPIAFAVARSEPERMRQVPDPPEAGRDHATGLPLRPAAVSALDAALGAGQWGGRTTGAVVLVIDEAEALADRHGRSAQAQVLRRTAERLRGALREQDRVVRLDGGRFAVALGAVRRLDLEAALQIAARLKAAAEAPLSIDAMTLHITVSAGFCLASRAPGRSGEALLSAAEAAAEEARLNGPGAIRAFSTEMQRAILRRDTIAEEAAAALEAGEIIAHFQPQLSTETGEVSGVEALARWQHPSRGLLPPADFLPALRAAGLSARLGEVMLYHALTALRGWDRAGLRVPTVAVNFSAQQLADPRLADRIRWELDRFDIPPDRLVVEVLESVVADAGNDVVTRNIAALSQAGCGIDLDDFGTGQAAIANIRRFAVNRIKLDRSFVTRVDADPDQQRMASAILSLAERLGLGTVAEGVETTGEHAMLAQLGCGHVQGFSIGRPMAFDESLGWLERHRGKLPAMPRIGRQAG